LANFRLNVNIDIKVMLESLTNRVETASLYFQGGVRRSVLIFAGICILLVAPLYFFGQLAAQVWFQAPFNPAGFNPKNSLIQTKVVANNDYIIERTQFVPLIGGRTILYTTINNRQNQQVGYLPFIYRVQILNSEGSILSNEIKQSYLLPGEVKYIIQEVQDSDEETATELRVSTEPKTQGILYNPAEDNLAERINIEVRNPTISEYNGDNLRLEALVKNDDLVKIRNLDLLYIIRDDRDRVVGIGEFRLEDVNPQEEREFSLVYPKPRFRTATRLEVRAFVNYLNQDNVVLP
jgi:hypothetical protein